MHALTALLFALLSSPLLIASDHAAVEFTGVFDHQPVWARWLAPDPAFGNRRALQLVYTPPLPETIDGTHLSDCPFILLDDQARIIAWNGRATASDIKTAEQGYRIVREIDSADAEHLKTDEHTLSVSKTWDVRLIPMHLALVWSATSSGTATAVDLFAAKPGTPLIVTWTPGKLVVGNTAWRAEADRNGRLHQLFDAQGRERLRIDSHKP